MKANRLKTVHCDECNQTFPIRKLYHMPIDGDVHVHGIQCPCCKAFYPVFYSNSRSRQLDRRLRAANLTPVQRSFISDQLGNVTRELQDKYGKKV